MRAAVRNADIVVHLAAEMDFFPHSRADEERMRRVNVGGTQQVMEACMAEGVRRFIYCSSTEAVGPTARTGEKARESHSASPTSKYGESKLDAEEACLQYGRLHPQLDILILRLTGVFGPRDSFSIFELINNINYGWLFFIPGDGQALLMYTHVEDVCRGIQCAIDKRPPDSQQTSQESPRIYNICPDEALTYQRWIEVLCELLGRAKPRLFLPFPLVKAVTAIAAPIMNYGKQRTFMWQAETIDRMAEHRNYDNSLAKRELGFKPRHSIESGLADVVRYNFSHRAIQRYFLAPSALIGLAAVTLFFYLSHLLVVMFF